jgi:two-component system, sensor histidine kinase and response regulator
VAGTAVLLRDKRKHDYSETEDALVSCMRFLLIENDPDNAERISSALTQAKHTVTPTGGFGEASEALEIQKFDAILLPHARLKEGFQEFTGNLRRFECSQRNATRTCILSFAGTPSHEERGPGLPVDGFITDEIGSDQFVQTVTRLATSIGRDIEDKGPCPESNFDRKRFLDQVGGDRELALEILGLFLVERVSQMADICSALEAEDADRLSRAAHTIKGSIGTVAGERARLRAQELENAAKKRDFAACRALTLELDSELELLEAELLRFRAG